MLEEIEKLKLPDVLSFNDGNKVKSVKKWYKRREEVKELLSTLEYGYIPKHVKFETKILEKKENYLGGKTLYKKVLLTMLFEKPFSFVVNVIYPKTHNKIPLFLYISFYKEFFNRNLPVEEICDNGFGIASFCYKDISKDNDRFDDEICKALKIKDNKFCGKIAIWAWAALQVMDYLQTVEEIDKENIGIVGFSRLGKTALLAGAYDERFKYVISNDSGQSGAAISRGKTGEKISDICKKFPYWFCKEYSSYSNKEQTLPFDQHFLTSLIAPRYLYVASASEDLWADPLSEFINCIVTSKVYNLYKKEGFVCKDFFPTAGDIYHNGYIGYHLRQGTHDLVRYDWRCFMAFIKLKTGK